MPYTEAQITKKITEMLTKDTKQTFEPRIKPISEKTSLSRLSKYLASFLIYWRVLR